MTTHTPTDLRVYPDIESLLDANVKYKTERDEASDIIKGLLGLATAMDPKEAFTKGLEYVRRLDAEEAT